MAKNRKRKKSGPKPAVLQDRKKTETPEKNKDVTSIILIALIIAIVVAMIAAIFIFAVPNSSRDNSASQPASASDTAADSQIDENLIYTAHIKIKGHGTIKVDLDQDAAPITVANFVGLARSGFYDGLTFHRIIKGFMMQGGDPEGTGSGGSGNNIKGEFSNNGVNNPLSHTRGAISMARNSIDMDSASSQFFIVQTDRHISSLDGKYAAFGYVTEGMDIVDEICDQAKPIDDNGKIKAEDQPVIESITITERNKT